MFPMDCVRKGRDVDGVRIVRRTEEGGTAEASVSQWDGCDSNGRANKLRSSLRRKSAKNPSLNIESSQGKVLCFLGEVLVLRMKVGRNGRPMPVCGGQPLCGPAMALSAAQSASHHWEKVRYS